TECNARAGFGSLHHPPEYELSTSRSTTYRASWCFPLSCGCLGRFRRAPRTASGECPTLKLLEYPSHLTRNSLECSLHFPAGRSSRDWRCIQICRYQPALALSFVLL